MAQFEMILVAVSILACTTSAAALSWPLCEQGGAVWVTERPRTEPTFPGANLWYFCDGSFNINGNSIDPCARNGTVCNIQVANAICSLLGYERAFPDDLTIVPAAPGEPVIALTGDFCLRKGVYAKSIPDDLASLPGEPCSKIQKITCIRTLDTMQAALALGLQNAELAALNPAPAAETLAATARQAEAEAKEAGAMAPTTGAPEGSAAAGQPVAEVPEMLTQSPSGRKLMMA